MSALHLPHLPAVCRAYRAAYAGYERAFVRGDVNAIEEAFSRMQDIRRAFQEGAEWARNQTPKVQR